MTYRMIEWTPNQQIKTQSKHVFSPVAIETWKAWQSVNSLLLLASDLSKPCKVFKLILIRKNKKDTIPGKKKKVPTTVHEFSPSFSLCIDLAKCFSGFHSQCIHLDNFECIAVIKGIYWILADFHFLQDRANFWQTDLFWRGKHRSVILFLFQKPKHLF